jgi:hypothetical protein
MFTDEQYMPAWKKERVLADWQRFIRGGFRYHHFSPDLYQQLSLHCSFIAHTDRRRFWEHYFNSAAAALAVFMNQFGGTKVAAETRWVDWRSGTAADLKEAMCNQAEAIFPTFERLLTTYALERYEAEKWADAQERLAQLPAQRRDAQAMSHLGLLIELVFPFEVYLNHLRVDDELRDRLDFEAAPVIEAPWEPVPPFDAAEWELKARAGETTAVQHLSLFDEGEARSAATFGLTTEATPLAERIAALSAENEAAQRSAAPLVIENERAMPLENSP